LAQKFGGILSGRVGDHGTSFILDEHRGRKSRTRARISELVAEAAARARRLGFSLHAGVAQAPDGSSVPAAYRAARWAAEKALAQNTRVVYGEPRPEHSLEHLRQIRDRLEKSIEQRPDLLMPRFDQYVDSVLAHAAYRIEAARTELEIAVERLVAPLLAANLLEQKTLSDLRATQDRATAEAQTVSELVAAYRGMVAGIESALRNPTVARQERSTRRAMVYVGEHLAETLTLKQGARVAGLAPSHFARLFAKSEGVSFASYVRTQRLQRARDMLQTTALSVEQIQKLCGFRSRASFYRVFKHAIGTTPGEFRHSA
jgi:AraC-like DNA-binding protein